MKEAQYIAERAIRRGITEMRERERQTKADKLARCKMCGAAVPNDGKRMCKDGGGKDCES